MNRPFLLKAGFAFGTALLMAGCASTDCGQEPENLIWEANPDAPGPGHDYKDLNPEDLNGRYWYRVQDIIQENFFYPPKAAQNSCEGVVRLRIKIRADGTVQRIEVMQKSGSGYLDQGAVDIIRRIGQFPPVPHPTDEFYVFEIPLNFERGGNVPTYKRRGASS